MFGPWHHSYRDEDGCTCILDLSGRLKIPDWSQLPANQDDPARLPTCAGADLACLPDCAEADPARLSTCAEADPVRLPTCSEADPARLHCGAVRLADCARLRLIQPGLVVLTPENYDAARILVYDLTSLFSANRKGKAPSDECKKPSDSGGQPIPLRTCRSLDFLCFDKSGTVTVDYFKPCLVIRKIVR